MMKKKLMFLLLIIVILSNSYVKANTNDPVLISINGEEILKSEFLKAYKKNKVHSDIIDPKSTEEYLDLYLNFRLKVKEAKALGMDTTETFIKEFENYRNQLATPYLTDRELVDEMVEESYNRMRYHLRASHILVAVPKYASPEDTLEAYNKIIKLRERILEGEDFADIAKEYSDDPSARERTVRGRRTIPGNKGDLGYFTSLQIPDYEFENVAYNLNINEISEPVRGTHGYHLIKVTEKHIAPEEVRIAHIMINSTNEEQTEKAEEKINEIYEKLTEGNDFEELVKEYSDDRASADKGGVLSINKANKMITEFAEVVYKFENVGDFSEPVKTNNAWHIIKLVDRKPLRSFDEMYHELKAKVKQDPERDMLSKKSVVNNLLDDSEFQEYRQNLDLFYEIVDNSVFQRRWFVPEDKNMDEILFVLNDKEYKQKDFAKFIQENQQRRNPQEIYSFINQIYETFKVKEIIDYKNQRLEKDYPEFNEMIREYHDGILLFELTNKKVWSKAMEDTAGLKDFYEENKEKYVADFRIKATIYSCDDKRTARRIRRNLRRIDNNAEAYKEIKQSLDSDEEKKMEVNTNTFYKKDLAFLNNNIDFQKGVSRVISNNNKHYIVHVHEVFEQGPKPLSEVRGLVIADYQNSIEKQWIEELRDKYKIVVNEDVFSQIVDY